MSLSNELIAELVKATTSTNSESKEETVYGTTVMYDGEIHVRLDGSDQITPVTTIATVGENERVKVSIKNHTATIIGSLTSPSATYVTVQKVEEKVVKLDDEFDKFKVNTLDADTIKANYATIKDLNVTNANVHNLEGTFGDFKELTAKNFEATNADIDNLSATKIDAETVEAEFAKIVTLESDYVKTEVLDAVRADVELMVAEKASIGDLDAVVADIEKLEADKASIEDLNAAKADITELLADKASIGELNAATANIGKLEADYGEFKATTTGYLNADRADIDRLNVNVFDAETGNVKFANIDFSNIGEAAIEEFYSKSGLIKDIVVGDGTITGELVGVTIKGDLIEAGTVKADKLVVLGSDGVYYKLNVLADGEVLPEHVTDKQLQNGLLGTKIIAKTITAEKISVHDLVAFDATIGGFVITDNSIHSYAKESVDNTLPGIYMDNDGQFVIGDSNNYLKYYRDENGNYRLDITAVNIRFGSSGKSVEEAVEEAGNIQIGGRNLIRNSKNLIFESYRFMAYEPDGASSAVLGRGRLGSMILGRG